MHADTEVAVGAVAGDDVAGTGHSTADEIASRACVEDVDATLPIRDDRGSGNVNPDVVALNDVVRRRVDRNADTVIARNHVACRDRRPADGITSRLLADENAVAAVRHCRAAGGICANQVAGNHIARGNEWRLLSGSDYDAVADVPGDHISRDRVVRRFTDVDPAKQIWKCGGAGRIGADVVTLDEVARRAASKRHAVAAAAGDQITMRSRRPADSVVRAAENLDACIRIGNGSRSSSVGADVIADHPVVLCGGAVQHDAGARVP